MSYFAVQDVDTQAILDMPYEAMAAMAQYTSKGDILMSYDAPNHRRSISDVWAIDLKQFSSQLKSIRKRRLMFTKQQLSRTLEKLLILK